MTERHLLPYEHSLAGTLLAAREAVMAPIRPFLRDAGVTEQQWRVLRVLSDEKDIDASRLARAALLHAPSVTRILKELQDRGLIERVVDPADKRRSTINLRPAGRKLVAHTADHTLKIIDRFDDQFGSDRLARLRTELAAFVRMIGTDAMFDEDL